MPYAPNPALDAETIRRMAAQEVPIALTPAEVERAGSSAQFAPGGDPGHRDQ